MRPELTFWKIVYNGTKYAEKTLNSKCAAYFAKNIQKIKKVRMDGEMHELPPIPKQSVWIS